jgi:predicted MFS family arabinose efflux permease
VVAGLVVLALFVAWESRLTALPGGEPLIDLSLFHSRSFTWGVLLTSVGIFGLFGVLFGLPQYFQAIMGVDPQGSGFRLLPTVAGLLVGAVTADRVNARIGAKLTVALGFAVVVAGSLVGATMTATSSDGFIAGWTFIVGLGGGMGFATAASAALVELSPDRSGVGAALLQAVVKLGPAFGASFLGSILNSTYQAQVAVAGLPDSAAAAVKASVFGGLSVAQQVGSAALLDSVRAAFVAGMDDAVRVTAGVAIVGIVLALLFLPARARAARLVEAPGPRPVT